MNVPTNAYIPSFLKHVADNANSRTDIPGFSKSSIIVAPLNIAEISLNESCDSFSMLVLYIASVAFIAASNPASVNAFNINVYCICLF